MLAAHPHRRAALVTAVLDAHAAGARALGWIAETSALDRERSLAAFLLELRHDLDMRHPILVVADREYRCESLKRALDGLGGCPPALTLSTITRALPSSNGPAPLVVCYADADLGGAFCSQRGAALRARFPDGAFIGALAGHDFADQKTLRRTNVAFGDCRWHFGLARAIRDGRARDFHVVLPAEPSPDDHRSLSDRLPDLLGEHWRSGFRALRKGLVVTDSPSWFAFASQWVEGLEVVNRESSAPSWERAAIEADWLAAGGLALVSTATPTVFPAFPHELDVVYLASRVSTARLEETLARAARLTASTHAVEIVDFVGAMTHRAAMAPVAISPSAGAIWHDTLGRRPKASEVRECVRRHGIAHEPGERVALLVDRVRARQQSRLSLVFDAATEEANEAARRTPPRDICHGMATVTVRGPSPAREYALRRWSDAEIPGPFINYWSSIAFAEALSTALGREGIVSTVRTWID